MFKHYLASALRHFRQHKVTATLNVACLAIGLLCFLGVYGLVAYLQGSDRHLPNSERVLAITQQFTTPGSRPTRTTMPMTAWVVGKHLLADFPQLDAMTRATMSTDVPLTTDNTSGPVTKMGAAVRYVDANFFDVFALPLIAGDRQHALRSPRSVVLSTEMAGRLFGDKHKAVGRSIVAYGTTSLTVTGVLDAIPQPSHLSTDSLASPFQRFDVLVTMDVYETRMAGSEGLQSWNGMNTSTYVVLPTNGSLTHESFSQQLAKFSKSNVPSSDVRIEFTALSLAAINLASLDAVIRVGARGLDSITMLYFLGGLVLLIACLNYANLASAQAATRAKEIGLRRIVGASRRQVITQYLFEAALSSVLAAIIGLAALTLILMAIPVLNERLGIADYFIRQVLPSPSLWLMILGSLCTVTLLAGAYPAFVLSNVRPIRAVRTGQPKSDRRRLTALIVGAQFVSASFLLIAILVMQAQSERMRSSAFATLNDPLLLLANRSDTPVNFDALQAELLRQPHIKSVTAADTAPWSLHGPGTATSLTSDPTATRHNVAPNTVNRDFFATMEVKLLAGRQFDLEHANDDWQVAAQSDVGLNVVVDEKFVAQHGWQTPQEAIGKTVYRWRMNKGQATSRPLNVVGVVENKPLMLLNFGDASTMYFFSRRTSNAIVIRASKDDARAAVNEIDGVWERLAPNLAIQRRFADEALNSAMSIFDIIGRVFGVIALFALVIAMLGLVGISIHATHRRTHEIGVRKTLGASARTILVMLLKDFSKPVLIANLIAWPLAYVLMRAYLSIFTQSAGLSAAPFIFSLVITMLVAWLAVSAQVIRAARLNPATVLRAE